MPPLPDGLQDRSVWTETTLARFVGMGLDGVVGGGGRGLIVNCTARDWVTPLSWLVNQRVALKAPVLRFSAFVLSSTTTEVVATGARLPLMGETVSHGCVTA